MIIYPIITAMEIAQQIIFTWSRTGTYAKASNMSIQGSFKHETCTEKNQRTLSITGIARVADCLISEERELGTDLSHVPPLPLFLIHLQKYKSPPLHLAFDGFKTLKQHYNKYPFIQTKTITLFSSRVVLSILILFVLNTAGPKYRHK